MSRFRSLRFQLFPLLAFFTLSSVDSLADVVLTNNGDRLSGEIQELADRRVSLKTSYAGTIQINWEMVDGLTTEEVFEVELATGFRYRGRLKILGEELEVSNEKEVYRLDVANVIGLRPKKDEKEPSFWESVEGTVDLGYAFRRGNAKLNQSTLIVRAERRTEARRMSYGLRSVYSVQDDSDPTSRQTTNLRVDWFVNPQLFRFALADFERNDNQQLNFRNAVGGGVGHTLIKSRTSELSVLAGATFTVERFRLEETSEESHKVWGGEGLVGLEWESQLLPWLRVNTELSVHPDLISGGDYRINYDTTLRIPLFKRLSWSLNFFDRFDTKAPEEVDRNDYGLISAFGLEF